MDRYGTNPTELTRSQRRRQSRRNAAERNLQSNIPVQLKETDVQNKQQKQELNALRKLAGATLGNTLLLTIVSLIGVGFSVIAQNIEAARLTVVVMFTNMLNRIAEQNNLPRVSQVDVFNKLGNLTVTPCSVNLTTITGCFDNAKYTPLTNATMRAIRDTLLKLANEFWQGKEIAKVDGVIRTEWTSFTTALSTQETIGFTALVTWNNPGLDTERKNAHVNTYVQALTGVAPAAITPTTPHFMSQGTGGNGNGGTTPHAMTSPRELVSVGSGNGTGTPRG